MRREQLIQELEERKQEVLTKSEILYEASKEIQQILKPYISKKIIRKDGRLIKKVNKQINQILQKYYEDYRTILKLDIGFDSIYLYDCINQNIYYIIAHLNRNILYSLGDINQFMEYWIGTYKSVSEQDINKMIEAVEVLYNAPTQFKEVIGKYLGYRLSNKTCFLN